VTGLEPSWTNWHTHAFKECLDYIMIASDERCDSDSGHVASDGVHLPHNGCLIEETSSRWHAITHAPRPIAVLQVPSDEQVLSYEGGAAGGCPNAGYGSDHILIAARLLLPI
jgi:hypothetical protein